MISTPGVGIRKLLAKNFPLYMVDEYKTSCLHHRTEERCNNLHVISNDGKRRKLHAVLTYQRDNQRMECINRDINAANNIRKVTEAALKGEPRPPAFVRQNVANVKNATNPVLNSGGQRRIVACGRISLFDIE